MAAYTTTDLLNSIKRAILIPAFQGQFTNADLLAFADEEMNRRLINLITSLKSNFFTLTDSVTTVSGTADYAIPYRSIGRGTRELKFRDDTASDSESNLAEITIEDEHLYTNISGDPIGYHFFNDKIRLVPSPSSGGTLRIYYNLRPSRLVEVSSATTITAVDTANSQITVSSVPSSWTVGTELDLIPAKAGNFPLQIDNAITAIVSNVITLTTAPLSTTVVGDYVSLSDTTPVLQIPQEFMQLLSLMVQCRVLSAIGDTEMLGKMEQERELAMQIAMNLIDPRNEGERKKVTNTNGLVRRHTRYFRNNGTGIV